MDFFTEEVVIKIGLGFLIAAIGWFLNSVFSFIKETNPWKRFLYKLSTAEQYWKLTTVFVVLVLAAAVVIIFTSNTATLVNNLSLLVETATLIFGVYVGYFAFKQLNLGRFEIVLRGAKKLFRDYEFKKAIKEYEAATDIKFTFDGATEQAECYAALKDWPGYGRIISRLKNAEVDEKDELVLFYLKALKPFIEEDIGAVKEHIREAIKAKKKMSSEAAMPWTTDEIEKSDAYNKIEKGTKDLFKSFCSYLRGALALEEKDAFEKTYG